MIALIISLCSGAIVYAVSVMYAGIGETFSERAGIMNLGVEGVMLMGAVSGYIIFGCMMMSISGACVSLANTNFWNSGMTAGKGWIAFALVAFSSWNPVMLMWGALLFGFISCLGSNLQIYLPSVPTEVYSMLPYIATVIVFILSTGNFRKKHTAEPAALAKPYDRESR